MDNREIIIKIKNQVDTARDYIIYGRIQEAVDILWYVYSNLCDDALKQHPSKLP